MADLRRALIISYNHDNDGGIPIFLLCFPLSPFAFEMEEECPTFPGGEIKQGRIKGDSESFQRLSFCDLQVQTNFGRGCEIG